MSMREWCLQNIQKPSDQTLPATGFVHWSTQGFFLFCHALMIDQYSLAVSILIDYNHTSTSHIYVVGDVLPHTCTQNWNLEKVRFCCQKRDLLCKRSFQANWSRQLEFKSIFCCTCGHAQTRIALRNEKQVPWAAVAMSLHELFFRQKESKYNSNRKEATLINGNPKQWDYFSQDDSNMKELKLSPSWELR